METRPAIYTTEFWVWILGTIAVVLNWADVWDWASNWHAGVIWAVLGAAYMISRGQAKQGVAADPANVANFKLFPRQRDAVGRK